jgi:hypothetical protein
MQWLTTAPEPGRAARAHSADCGQRGWRLHAVAAGDKETLGDIRTRRAACGLLPSHGWGMDLFINQRCVRCERATKPAT